MTIYEMKEMKRQEENNKLTIEKWNKALRNSIENRTTAEVIFELTASWKTVFEKEKEYA